MQKRVDTAHIEPYRLALGKRSSRHVCGTRMKGEWPVCQFARYQPTTMREKHRVRVRTSADLSITQIGQDCSLSDTTFYLLSFLSFRGGSGGGKWCATPTPLFFSFEDEVVVTLLRYL